MIRWFVFIGIVLGVGWSCSRELAVPLPFEGPRLVILAVLSAGESITVTVDHTYPPTGETLFSAGVTNAKILLYENNLLVDTLRLLVKNQYVTKSTIRPAIGKIYRIKVEAPGYPSVESNEEMVPDFPVTRNVNVEKKDKYTLSVTIQDTPNARNQYEIRFISYYKKWETAVNLDNLSRPDAITDNCGFRGNQNAFYYRDLCFDNSSLTTNYGSSLEGTPRFEVDSLYRTIKGNPLAERVVVRVRSVSESYLKYYQYQSSQDIEQAFQQPASRFTNLKGGYGIMLLYAEKSVSLAVP